LQKVFCGIENETDMDYVMLFLADKFREADMNINGISFLDSLKKLFLNVKLLNFSKSNCHAVKTTGSGNNVIQGNNNNVVNNQTINIIAGFDGSAIVLSDEAKTLLADIVKNGGRPESQLIFTKMYEADVLTIDNSKTIIAFRMKSLLDELSSQGLIRPMTNQRYLLLARGINYHKSLVDKNAAQAVGCMTKSQEELLRALVKSDGNSFTFSHTFGGLVFHSNARKPIDFSRVDEKFIVPNMEELADKGFF